MQCRKSTFWYTSVPLGILNGALVTLGTIKGPLYTHPKAGPIPYIVVAILIGILIGTLTNHSILVRRFLTEQPNSRTSKEYRREYNGIPDDNIITEAQKETNKILYKAYPLGVVLSSAVVFSASRGVGIIIPYVGLWTQAVMCAVFGFNLGLYLD